MAYSDAQLRQIYDKTDGYCFHCGMKLAYTNYGVYGARGAWHVDHGRPRSRGGTGHANNLHAACIDCNLGKGDRYPWRR